MRTRPTYHPPRWFVLVAIAATLSITTAGAMRTPEPKPSASVKYSGDTARVITTVYAKCNPGCPTSYAYLYTFGGTGVPAPTTHTVARTVDTLVVTPRLNAVGQTRVTPFKGTVAGTPVTASWSITAYVSPPVIDTIKVRIDTTVVVEYWAMLYTPAGAPLIKSKPSAAYTGPFEWYYVGTGHNMDLSTFTWYEGDSLRAIARLRIDSAGQTVRTVIPPDMTWQTPPTPLIRLHVVGARHDTVYHVAIPCNCPTPPGGYGAARLRLRGGQFRYEFPTLSGAYRAAQ